MISITQQQEMGNVPVEELAAAAGALRGPRLDRLPDKRLREVGLVMILGRLAGQSRLIRQMARGMREGSGDVLGRARGFYRFIWNKPFSQQTLPVGLYASEELVVAMDPVNFEKPYSHEFAGVSTVYKSPCRRCLGGGA